MGASAITSQASATAARPPRQPVGPHPAAPCVPRRHPRYVPARQQLFVVTPKKTVTLKGELHTEPLDSIRLAFYCGRVGADEDEVHLSARPPTRPKRAFHPVPKKLKACSLTPTIVLIGSGASHAGGCAGMYAGARMMVFGHTVDGRGNWEQGGGAAGGVGGGDRQLTIATFCFLEIEVWVGRRHYCLLCNLCPVAPGCQVKHTLSALGYEKIAWCRSQEQGRVGRRRRS